MYPVKRADLSLVKSADADVAVAGQTVTYGVVVTNRGPHAAADVTVTDPAPAGARVISVTPSTGVCRTGATVVCKLGDIPNGASATIRLAVVFDVAGTSRNVATVTSPTPDPNPGNNTGETTVTNEKADLALTKTAATRAVKLGGVARYTLVATNHGPSPAHGVVITDVAPANLRLTGASPSAGACEVTGREAVCEVGDLPAGGSASVTVTGRVVRQGVTRNAASVTSRTPSDPDLSNNVASSTVTGRPGAATIAVAKRADRRAAAAGERVRYRITLRNTGARTANAVEVCDRLPRGMAFTARGGAKLRNGRACWTVARLAPRASVSFRVTARVLAGRGGRLTNVVRAKGANTVAKTARASVRRPVSQVRPGGVTG